MFWVSLSIAFAGLLSGFFAGATSKVVGGELSSMIGGVIVGILAGLSQSKALEMSQVSEVGKLLFLFQVSLLASYLLSNIARKKGWFRCIY